MARTTIRSGEFTLTQELVSFRVYRNGEPVGHFWEDKWEGYAVFRSGESKPIARLKTVRGCVRKVTGGVWDGTGEEETEGER